MTKKREAQPPKTELIALCTPLIRLKVLAAKGKAALFRERPEAIAA
jgi:hypothetical protein